MSQKCNEMSELSQALERNTPSFVIIKFCLLVVLRDDSDASHKSSRELDKEEYS